MISFRWESLILANRHVSGMQLLLTTGHGCGCRSALKSRCANVAKRCKKNALKTSDTKRASGLMMIPCLDYTVLLLDVADFIPLTLTHIDTFWIWMTIWMTVSKPAISLKKRPQVFRVETLKERCSWLQLQLRFWSHGEEKHEKRSINKVSKQMMIVGCEEWRTCYVWQLACKICG